MFPFHADVVGSFLRSDSLKSLHSRFKLDQLSFEDLRSAEDSEITRLVRLLESIGFRSVTDGELRRSWHNVDFFRHIRGIEVITIKGKSKFHCGTEVTNQEVIHIVDRISFPENHPQIRDFLFLKDKVILAIPKMTIPSPLELTIHGVSNHTVYPDDALLFDDIVKMYQAALKKFYDAGCRYIQFDDGVWNFMCDQSNVRMLQMFGFSIETTLNNYVQIYQKIIENKPNDLKLAIHCCRGNYKSDWLYEGPYDPIAPFLFAQVPVDAFLLEFDDESRCGTFEALKHMKNQMVFLGLISSKKGELENKDIIIHKVHEAAKFFPIERLGISTQCGFASSIEGNLITQQEQWNKMKLVYEISKEIWNS